VKLFCHFLFPWISCFSRLLSCSVCAQISHEPNLSSIEPLKPLPFFSLLAGRASLTSCSVLPDCCFSWRFVLAGPFFCSEVSCHGAAARCWILSGILPLAGLRLCVCVSARFFSVSGPGAIARRQDISSFSRKLVKG
jgi:hypothetical protein